MLVLCAPECIYFRIKFEMVRFKFLFVFVFKNRQVIILNRFKLVFGLISVTVGGIKMLIVH